MHGVRTSAILFYLATAFSSLSDSTFTLSDIEYRSVVIYSTPAHLAVQYGEVHFNFTNSAIPFVSACAATERQPPDYFYGDRAYPCSTDTGNSTKTTFSYNRLDDSIHVNQTWLAYE
jgi:hypothetical protein